MDVGCSEDDGECTAVGLSRCTVLEPIKESERVSVMRGITVGVRDKDCSREIVGDAVGMEAETSAERLHDGRGDDVSDASSDELECV